MKLIKSELIHKPFTVHAMSFIPENIHPSQSVAVFTHGYTTHKGDVLPWASRFVEANIPCIIFDLPGHYLGSFNEVESFKDFENNAHQLFISAFDQLLNQLLNQGLNFKPQKLLLAGHSLGALLAIKALSLDAFKQIDRLAVGVGIGINQSPHVHLFETSFYQKTLQLRRQLVAPALDSDVMFPWIKKEKLNLNIGIQKVHLITGTDDVVVGEGGVQALANVLNQNQTTVTIEEPTKLPHHEPGLAASHLYSYFKKIINITPQP